MFLIGVEGRKILVLQLISSMVQIRKKIIYFSFEINKSAYKKKHNMKNETKYMLNTAKPRYKIGVT